MRIYNGTTNQVFVYEFTQIIDIFDDHYIRISPDTTPLLIVPPNKPIKPHAIILDDPYIDPCKPPKSEFFYETEYIGYDPLPDESDYDLYVVSNSYFSAVQRLLLPDSEKILSSVTRGLKVNFMNSSVDDNWWNQSLHDVLGLVFN